MKEICLTLLGLHIPFLFLSQSTFNTLGAQCGTHGSNLCEHYQSPCPAEFDAEILLFLQTDQNASETSWQVLDNTEMMVVAEGDNLNNNTTYEELICAHRDHCYTFKIQDSGNDGLDPESSNYSVFWNGDTIKVGGVFTAMDSVDMGGCCTEFEANLIAGMTCSSNHFGQAFVETEGGSGPFAYEWSTGATFTAAQPFSEADASISVEVTDGSGCLDGDTLDLLTLNNLNVSITTQVVSTAGGSDGMITAIPAGGFAPYSYAWSNGEMSSMIGSLMAGNYTVSVTDAYGCTVIQATGLKECDECVVAFEVESSNIFMNGNLNGLLLKAPDNNCWYISIDDDNNFQSIQSTCDPSLNFSNIVIKGSNIYVDGSFNGLIFTSPSGKCRYFSIDDQGDFQSIQVPCQSQSNNSNVEIENTNIFVDGSNMGLIMQSPDKNCWIVRVDNSGQLTVDSVNCPDSMQNN